jgi:hypothetical protein
MRRSNFSDVRHVRKTAFPTFILHTYPTARLKGKTWQNKKGEEILIKSAGDYLHILLSKPTKKKKEERQICEVLRFSQRGG